MAMLKARLFGRATTPRPASDPPSPRRAMRHAARRDANEADIIKALRKAGASVDQIDAENLPDLVVGFRYHNFLMEVKDPAKPPSKRKLRAGQKLWHDLWRGQVAVVETEEEALAVLEL